MRIFVQIVVYVMLFYTIFSYLRTKRFINCINKDKKHNKLYEKKQIIIAIPALREQSCIYETVKYFSEIARNIPIVLITTQREIEENIENKKTTQDIIKEQILPKFKNVFFINYPYTNGYMANQLNYMLDNLNKIFNKKINLKDTYLALYNADSRPGRKTFLEIEKNLSTNTKVIQQYSYCMQNYDNINGILKGFALYQSNFELKTGMVNAFFESNILYTHIVGHGLIIELNILKKLGNFNTNFWCEDIYLGLQLKANNIKIKPLLTLENIQTPDSLSKLVKQNSVWFKTTSQFSKMYKDILKKGKISNKLYGMIGMLNEFRCALNWLGFPFVICVTIITTIIIKEYCLLSIFLLSYLLYIIINVYNTITIINKLDNKNYKLSVRMIVNVFLATAISNLGPIYSIIINKKEKYKTER